jgi:predicted nucleic acid-binding protein
MKPVVYIETTFVSYLTAWTSRDLVRAAQQRSTHEWWDTQRSRFDVLTSELVVLEASAGDSAAASERLRAIASLVVLKVDDRATQTAVALLAAGAVPQVAARDALHVGLCAANGIDYLLTWNFRHLANAVLRDKISDVCRSLGYRPPVICTPDELSED